MMTEVAPTEVDIAKDTERRIAIMSKRTFSVVCICGSMKFYDWMLKVAEKYTLAGNIVLMPLVRKDSAMTESEKQHQHKVEQALPSGTNLHILLDGMHRVKIDMASEIIVCTDANGYFGDSTRSEIAYAAERSKTIKFEKQPVSAL